MSTKYGGYMGKVLKVDLTTKEISEYPWSDKERERYLGGKIMAAKILYDNVTPDIQPLSPENILVISTGPLTGTGAPSSSRFNISTLSPLTGYITSSNCGGTFGMFLKKAGYDALILTGRCKNPTWIEIKEEEVIFHNAENLWGKKTTETQEKIGGRSGKIVIGPAGENLVKYASIFSGERAAGRGGTGAVMGSKNLKAVTAFGNKKTQVYNREKMKEVYKNWIKTLKNHPLTGEQLPKLGTAGLVRRMQERKILATRNYKYGQYKDFELVSGEYLTEKYLIKNKGCITCPIQCGRVVEVNGKPVKGPELETLGLLGPNIENNNLELILKWNYELDELGMDTISTASTIAFAMELQEKGLWETGLEFGKTENILDIFEDIAYRRGVGYLLADGTKLLSQKFGGKEFAINSKGMELAAYEPREAVGQGLGYAVANRGGCHLNAGYIVLLEGLGLSMDPHTTKSKAALNIMFQNMMEAVSAAGNCLFNLYTAIPGELIRKPNSASARFVNKFLENSGGLINIVNKLSGKMMPINISMFPQIEALSNVTGMKMTFGKLKEVGERGYNLERLINVKLGVTSKDDSLPKRLTHEVQDPNNPKSVVQLEVMKKEYYKIRGWNENGIPTEKKLRKLKLIGEN